MKIKSKRDIQLYKQQKITDICNITKDAYAIIPEKTAAYRLFMQDIRSGDFNALHTELCKVFTYTQVVAVCAALRQLELKAGVSNA